MPRRSFPVIPFELRPKRRSEKTRRKKFMAKTTTKKAPAKKKPAVKKAPAKKKVTKKPVVKKVVKKAPAKKKPVAKLSAPIATPETPVVLEIQTQQLERPVAPSKKKEHVVVKKHVVFVHRCQNCHHMPVSVNALFSLFVALIVALSTMVVVGAGGVDLQPILADATPEAPAISVVLNH
jgi:hypothetical protein